MMGQLSLAILARRRVNAGVASSKTTVAGAFGLHYRPCVRYGPSKAVYLIYLFGGGAIW